MASAVEYRYDENKSRLLRVKRGIGFEEIIELIQEECLLGVRPHPNQARHPGQLLADVDINGYVYSVPFHIEGQHWHLKTLYPSRKANKKYFGG